MHVIVEFGKKSGKIVAISKKQHFRFLDGLRFICAVWVVFSHLGEPPIFTVFDGSALSMLAVLAQKVFSIMFNGTAAVVVFFIISGFCIHYPYVSGREFSVSAFYISRLTRIAIPMLAAIGISLFLPHGYTSLEAVLWSLYCEIVYYTIYPLLRLMYSRFDYYLPIAVSFTVSFGLALVPDQHDGFFWTYGVLGSALLGLPIWMLGCLVADVVYGQRAPKLLQHPHTGLVLRVSVLILCILTALLHNKTAFDFKFSMLLVAPFFALWVLFEFNQIKSFWLFEKTSSVGQGCYSIYLAHKLVLPTMSLFFVVEAGSPGWIFTMTGVVIGSAAFYFLIERPAHRLSKSLSKLKSRDTVSTLAD